MKGTAITLTAIIVIMIASMALAEVPQLINYSGRLTDAVGNPVADGVYQITFTVYDIPTGTPGLWYSGMQPVQVTDGLFTYQLGSVNPLPDSLFEQDTLLYLGVKVGSDPEIVPRTRLVSVGHAYHALRSDSAGYAMNIANNSVTESKIANYAVTEFKIANNSINAGHIQDQSITVNDIGYEEITGDQIDDGTVGLQELSQDGAIPDQVIKWNGSAWIASNDELGPGDITAVYPGSGLTGGGASGDVTLSVGTDAINETHIAADAVQSAEIEDGTIVNADINSSANISTSKISGTAVNLSSPQTITGDKTFDGTVYYGDSTMRVDNTGIRIGDNSNPSSFYLLDMQRDYNTTSNRLGLNIDLRNDATSGHIWGIIVDVENANGSSGDRYGGQFNAGAITNTAGVSYGVIAVAYGGTTAYGINASASGASTNYGGYFAPGHTKGAVNYAGYFNGDVGTSGRSLVGSGGFKIDHPLDPENQYLIHSDVVSPEMMNMYNGNVTLDANGEASVELPAYFESLNTEFRYQLTPIGASAPDLYIAEKISGNRFAIAGGKPYMEVSWLVTGIRNDAFANANRTQVEINKPENEKGLYLHPESFGLGENMQIHYEQNKEFLESSEVTNE